MESEKGKLNFTVWAMVKGVKTVKAFTAITVVEKVLAGGGLWTAGITLGFSWPSITLYRRR